jgi:hypothetical protein
MKPGIAGLFCVSYQPLPAGVSANLGSWTACLSLTLICFDPLAEPPFLQPISKGSQPKPQASLEADGTEASNRGQSSRQKPGTASRSQFLRSGLSPAGGGFRRFNH